MARLKENCPGDCSKCELLNTGQVDMVPCILDQIFRRVQNIELQNEELSKVNMKLQSELELFKGTGLKIASSKKDKNTQEDDK